MRALILFCFFTICLIGCDIFNSNEAPVIESINLNTQDIVADQTVIVNAVATDPDGDDITYSWTCSAGRILTGVSGYDINTNPTMWHSPSTPGECSITCTVNDGKITTSKSKSVSVKDR